MTKPSGAKQGVKSAALFSDWAILDANTTLTLPKGPTAFSGVDAMVHAIEAYTNRFLKNDLSDHLARKALDVLSKNIKTATFHANDETARGQMLLGSLYAGMSFANSPTGAVHGLALPVGAYFGVPHGLSNSLMLPRVLEFNAPVASKMYAEIAPICFPNIEGGTDSQKVDKFIEEVRGLSKSLELP